MRWTGHVARVEEERVQGLVGEPKGKRPLGRPRRRWGMVSEWILGRLAGGVEWIQLPQDRARWRVLINTVMNLQVLASRSYYSCIGSIFNAVHLSRMRKMKSASMIFCLNAR
jgi:hypothetical protein